MKQIWNKLKENFTWKKMILIGLFVIFLMSALILHWSRVHMIEKADNGKIHTYWSDENDWTWISCYFSSKEEIQVDDILRTRYNIEKKLKESSIDIVSENPSARLYVDAYSANGEVTMKHGENSYTGNAYGVGGDFFKFHPLKFIYGGSFSEADLMDDYVIIDETIAWKLFGSSNVVGKYITISEVPHKIVGVYQMPEDDMNKIAGNEKPTMYLSYASLAEYGKNLGINNYEVMMPNPVTGFASKILKDIWNKDEYSIVIMENSRRYDFRQLWDAMRDFPERSMSKNGIVYPTWENVARGYEDIAVRMLKWELYVLVIPAVIMIIWIFELWKKYKAWREKRRNEKKHY